MATSSADSSARRETLFSVARQSFSDDAVDGIDDEEDDHQVVSTSVCVGVPSTNSCAAAPCSEKSEKFYGAVVCGRPTAPAEYGRRNRHVTVVLSARARVFRQPGLSGGIAASLGAIRTRSQSLPAQTGVVHSVKACTV